jgi:hypothetical protein
MRYVTLFCALLSAAAATSWDPVVRLTDNDYADFSYWSCQRRVVVDPLGRVHAAWHVMDSDLGTYRFQIFYKRYTPGSGWSADTMLSADLYAENLNSKYVSLTVDSSGTVYAVWAAGASDDADEYIQIKSCVPEGSGNGGWQEVSSRLSVTAADYAKGCPNAAATPDGHVHVTWLEDPPSGGAYIAYRERIDTTWQPMQQLETSTNYKAYPALAGGTDNRLHLIWYGRSGPSGYYNVFYKMRSDTVWSGTENVSNGTRHQMYPSVAVNPATGNPHVLWQCYDAENDRRIVHAWRDAGGWQPRDTLTEADTLLDQNTGQIAFTPDGRGHALWGGRSPDWPTLDQVRYCERSVAGVWTAPFNVTDTGGSKERPSVTAGGGSAPNDVHVVWTDYRDGTAEIYYARGSPVQGLAEAGRLPGPGRPSVRWVSGVLTLEAGCRSAELWDANGRCVQRLHSGPNDVGRLAPGLYFLSEPVSANGGHPSVRKVLVPE